VKDADRRDEIDRLITDKLSAYVDSLPVSGKEEGWAAIEDRLFSRQPTRRRLTVRFLAVTVVVFVVLVLVVQMPVVEAWITRNLDVYVTTISGSVRNLLLHVSPRSSGGSSLSGAYEREVAPLLGKLKFRPLVIPPQSDYWQLSAAGLEPSGAASYGLHLTYTDLTGNKYVLHQEQLDSNQSTGWFFDADDTEVTEHTVRDNTVWVLGYRDGAYRAFWSEEGLNLSLEAQLSMEGVLEFISNLERYGRE